MSGKNTKGKNYVFRPSSTTPPEVIDYLAETMEEISFPKWVESIALEKLGKPVEKGISGAVSIDPDSLEDLKKDIVAAVMSRDFTVEGTGDANSVLAEAIGGIREDIAQLRRSMSVQSEQYISEMRKTLVNVFKKVDSASEERFDSLRENLGQSAEEASPATSIAEDQLFRKTVYAACLSAMRKFHEDKPDAVDNGNIEETIDEARAMLMFELGGTAEDQLETLVGIREDLDSLIEYVTGPEMEASVLGSKKARIEGKQEEDSEERQVMSRTYSFKDFAAAYEDEDDEEEFEDGDGDFEDLWNLLQGAPEDEDEDAKREANENMRVLQGFLSSLETEDGEEDDEEELEDEDDFREEPPSRRHTRKIYDDGDEYGNDDEDDDEEQLEEDIEEFNWESVSETDDYPEPTMSPARQVFASRESEEEAGETVEIDSDFEKLKYLLGL